jgi:hypothetical protein
MFYNIGFFQRKNSSNLSCVFAYGKIVLKMELNMTIDICFLYAYELWYNQNVAKK